MIKRYTSAGALLLSTVLLAQGSYADTTSSLRDAGVKIPGVPVEVISQKTERKVSTHQATINKVEPTQVSKLPPKASTMSKSDGIQHTMVQADVKPIKPIKPTRAVEPVKPATTKPEPYIPPAVNEAKAGEVMPLSMEKKVVKRPSLTFKTKEDIEVEQGVNEVISIAVSHLNRITTPFSNALVKTVDAGNVDVRGGILYVSTNQDDPVTLFIHEKGDESLALSITLIPRHIPPRDITLILKGMDYQTKMRKMTKKAKKWEQQRSYVDGLKDSMKALANGDIPNGYSLRNYTLADRYFDCRKNEQGISVEPKQVLDGHNIIYTVSLVENISESTIELTESFCYERGVLAVSFWPSVTLRPGEKTELYIAHKRPRKPRGNIRPSLVGAK